MTECNSVTSIRGTRVPLFQVAEWIASEGGLRVLDTTPVRLSSPELDDDDWLAIGWTDEVVHAWAAAIDELLQAIQNGEITVRGFRGGDLSRSLEPISGDEFGEKFSNPFADTSFELILSESRYLNISPDASKILNRRETFWSGLVASANEILERWPPTTRQKAIDPPRRPDLQKQTKPELIAAWLKEHHSDRPCCTNKELALIVRRDAPHLGKFSERTFADAIKLAYS